MPIPSVRRSRQADELAWPDSTMRSAPISQRHCQANGSLADEKENDMIRFNRRGWILSIRANQLAHLDAALRPAALALQAALVADGLVDESMAAVWQERGATAPARASRRCCTRQPHPLTRRSSPRPREVS
jgi:hypothetical protein